LERAEAKKSFRTCANRFSQHDYRYYVLAQPEIPDLDYDKLFRRLSDLEKSSPIW